MKKALIYIIFILTGIYGTPLLPFYADFTDNYWSEWYDVDVSPYSAGPSNWSVVDGVLKQTSNIYTTEDEYTVYSGTYVYAGDTLWQNYTIMAQYLSLDDDGFGVMVRYKDGDNFYRFMMVQDSTNGGPFRRIEKKVGGVFTTLVEDTSDFTYPSVFSWINFIAYDDSLIVYLDGVRFLATTDSDIPSGGVGFSCYANNDLSIDNVLVYPAKIETAPYTTVVTGPYLQMPSESSMTVCFELNLPDSAVVYYGLDTFSMADITDTTTSMRHCIQIDGLISDTLYYNRVATADTMISGPDYHFRTMGNENFFRLCIWGDNRTQYHEHYAVVHRMAQESCDVVINVGDVVTYGPNYTQWQREYFLPAEDVLKYAPSYIAIGNHEANAHWFYDYVKQPGNEHYFAFTRGPVRFIILDTNYPYTPGTDEYNWLINELSSDDYNDAVWKFVFHHHPPYSEGWDSPGYDGEADVRDYLVPLYEANDVTADFAGHTHDYERGEKDGVLYFITGGGGSPLDTWQQDWEYITVYHNVYQYMFIDISPSSLYICCKDTSGTVLDSITVYPLDILRNKNLPRKLKVSASPNPANSIIKFCGYAPENGRLNIYDLTGEKIDYFSVNKGKFDINWLPKVSSGIYIYKMISGNFIRKGKVIVLK